MGSYYKHRRVESVKVPYHFRCEQCMKESGLLTATVTGMEATHNSNYNVLTEKETRKLEEKAHAFLVRDLYAIYRDASQKQIIATNFRDECPHCHKPQSWGLTGMKKKLFDTPLVILGVGAVVSIIMVLAHYFEESGDVPLWLAGAAIAVTVVIALASLGWNLIQMGVKNKKVSAVAQKNMPSIEWRAVQHLLDEKNS